MQIAYRDYIREVWISLFKKYCNKTYRKKNALAMYSKALLYKLVYIWQKMRGLIEKQSDESSMHFIILHNLISPSWLTPIATVDMDRNAGLG